MFIYKRFFSFFPLFRVRLGDASLTPAVPDRAIGYVSLRLAVGGAFWRQASCLDHLPLRPCLLDLARNLNLSYDVFVVGLNAPFSDFCVLLSPFPRTSISFKSSSVGWAELEYSVSLICLLFAEPDWSPLSHLMFSGENV